MSLTSTRTLRAIFFLLSLLLIGYPSLKVYAAFQSGVLLLSIPHMAMFFCGIMALIISLRSRAWR